MSNISLKKFIISGKSAWPLFEGGKGVSISNGKSAGHWANAGGVGTFSAVNAAHYDENGQRVPIEYHGKTRVDRHEELVSYGIKGGIAQAQKAREISPNGVIHMNLLWEMGGAKRILNGILEQASSLIDGITCGAGMPYDLGAIASKYNVYFYPIVSSARAFNILYKRGKYDEYLSKCGGIVYEDPWLAGGHTGISNKENPEIIEQPYDRVYQLRKSMNCFGMHHVPIIMAGGIWNLNEWHDWIDNEHLGKIGFQFGTRPLLTKESPISDEWKEKLLNGNLEVSLNRFSPTGFYSSAVRNDFLKELEKRKESEKPYSKVQTEIFKYEYLIQGRAKVYLKEKIEYDNNIKAMKTPDNTLIFVNEKKYQQIKTDQINCMGCLARCKFSNWSENNLYKEIPDPRSFCIQKTLQNIAHGDSVESNLMFAGSNVNRFSKDEFYSNKSIPTVQELFNRILTGQ